jgi:type II secretory pathway pseudopilin PulG
VRPSMTQILRSQQGAALLILMLALFSVTMAVLLRGLHNRTGQLERQAATTAALMQAKEALIGYAVIYPTAAGPGHLPCPDTSPPAFTADGSPQPPYGQPNTPCGPGAIGRLPQTLPGVAFHADFNSAIDQQFWYAVGDPFLASPNTGIDNTLNATIPAPLNVDGRGDIAAVLIAPGPALAGQNRPSTNPADYLDGANSSGPNFSGSPTSSPDTFNDLVVAIDRTEILSPVTARVAEEIREYLDAYYATAGAYPVDQASFEVALAGGVPWLAANGWPTTTSYTQISADQFSLTFSGCGITYTVTFGTVAISRNQPGC